MNLLKGWQDMSGCTLYMNCSNDGRGASPNWNKFDSACTAAAYACGSDLACARDYVVRSTFLKTHEFHETQLKIKITTMVNLNGVQIGSMS